MNDMNNKKIFFTYLINENGEISLSKVVTVDGENVTSEDFEVEKHGELFLQFMEENEITLETLDTELEAKGLFDEKTITEEKINAYLMGVDAKTAGTDEMVNEEEEEKETGTSKTKAIIAGTLLAVTVAGLAIGLHSCSEEQVVEQIKDQTLEDLLKQMTPEQRAFFENSFKAVEEFNGKTAKEGNFKLYSDTSKLHMSVDEAVALNIVLNNYSAADLYEVFGTVEFDSTNVMNLARSAYSKLTTYYMNAKEASGLSAMINDPAARAFFEKHENAVIEFNNNPTRENSDKLINMLHDSYVKNGATGDYADINNDAVAWLSTTTAFGYELANRNVSEFGVTQDGTLSLNQITESEALSGNGEEVNIDVMDEVNNKGLCASVYRSVTEKISTLTTIQSVTTATIETNAKNELVEGLKESGNMSLANKVLNSELTPELLKEISSSNSKATELVEDYNERVAELSEKEAKVAGVINLATERYNVKEDVDLASLVNNRFRSALVLEREDNELTKEEQIKEDLYVGKDDKGNAIYDKDKLDKLEDEDKNAFIANNGEVVKKEEVVEKEEVKKEDLSKDELDKVVSEEKILSEIEELKNNLIEQGVYDAVDYSEEKGAYDYNGTLTIPYNNQTLNTKDMTLFNITAYDAAFGNKNITVDDSQIQNRMEKDSKEVDDEIESLSSEAAKYLEEKYGNDWKEDFKDESYDYGYTEQIKGILATAKELAPEIKKTAEAEFDKAQQEADKKNEAEQEAVTPSVPPVVEDDNYDPNLDPNYGSEEEEVYIPTTKTPFYYVSDAELDDALSSALNDELGSSKGK